MQVKEASFSYGNSLIFEKINLELKPGEIVAIVGSNGSGKSTLLKCIAGIYELDSGDITKEVEENVVFVPDVPRSYEYLTGFEYLEFIQAVSKKRDVSKVHGILKDYTLYPNKDKLIKHYSHGMKQKLALCAALINEEIHYLLLDEPLTGIDKKSQKVIIEKFKELTSKQCSIVFSTHQIETLREICDKVFYLEDQYEELVYK
ncbi:MULTISPECIES: ATP-binding cassette domain-containing protein [Bacillus]|uniref:ATP-binding cassette domain-containing protein n=1 Tax=Bacillus TaxID=1386 RepID=UPI0011AAFEDD|nr:ATP-binding cassette domain-containing protein [Bacillus safensis]UXO88347.1 ATP-binding cassette domain-containing protein [Bacillus safensis]